MCSVCGFRGCSRGCGMQGPGVLAGATGVRFPRRRCVPEAGRLRLRVRGPLQHTGWAGGGGLPPQLVCVTREGPRPGQYRLGGYSLVLGYASLLYAVAVSRLFCGVGVCPAVQKSRIAWFVYKEMVSLLCLQRWGIARFYTMVQCIRTYSSEFRVLRNCQTLAPPL